MRIRAWMLLAPALFSSLALLSAEEPPKTLPGQTVGSVYGKAVTAADIGLGEPIDPAIQFDARDTARWELMRRIMTAFGGPVVERFVKREKIEATRDEITKFKSNLRKRNERNLRQWEARLAELNKELAEPNLPNEHKTKLEKERAEHEEILASMREALAADVPEEMARTFIVTWKTERELHRVYGGRVIFQQAGPEALDARRRLFEQAEKESDIRFADAGVRHLFYYYANMRHTAISEKVLERPWFLEEGN
jgi:hypothetical protein